MKIGVVADTHSMDLPPQMLEAFRQVDLIIHAGDFCCLSVLDTLGKIREVKAVYGNMDDPDVRQRLPEKQIIECGSVKIGLYHGAGAAANILDTVQQAFVNDTVDAVVFGHSHQALNRRIGGVLYFNPGSATDTVRAPYRSYGIMDVNHSGVKAKIIKVDKS